MLRYSERHGKAESRKNKVKEGWGRSSRHARGKTGWGIPTLLGVGIGHDGDQGASQAMMDGSAEGWVRGRARVRAWG